MDWIQPNFGETDLPPPKKQRTDVSKAVTVKDKPVPKYEGTFQLDQFKPKTRQDLVVHKKKIDEVESWLQKLFAPNSNSRILLVTGPSGCGKMTTVKVLANSMAVGVVEWMNPLSSEYSSDQRGSYTSQIKSFSDFIGRATRYGSVLSNGTSRRVILVKDLPNVFFRDCKVFHGLLEHYSAVENVKLIFILTDGMLIRDLFPEELKRRLDVGVINFNPVTQKSVVACLTVLSRKVKGLSSNKMLTSYIQDVSFSCEGDLRNAMMTLQFLVSKKGNYSGSAKKTKAVKDEEETWKSLTADSPIDLFHGLGRTLYPKRDDVGKLKHDPDDVASGFLSCSSHFLSMLHGNYLNMFAEIKDVSKAAECLALSDVLLSDFRDNLSSNHLGLVTSVFGLMFYNPDPVKKFQQFNRYYRPDPVLADFKSSIKANFPNFGETEFLLDAASYIQFLPDLSNSKKQLSRDLAFKK